MLSGIMFPVDLLPKTFEIIGKVFPATWGFQIMTSNIFDIKLYMPLFIILFILICISGYRLSKMEVE